MEHFVRDRDEKMSTPLYQRFSNLLNEFQLIDYLSFET